MRNVLILSCSTGQGHNSCAMAVKEYFDKRGVNCEIEDAFRFVSGGFCRFMSWGHSFMYRHLPGLFRWGYRYSQKHPGVFRPDSGIYKLLTSGAENMSRYIAGKNYDTVICTHVLSAMILTQMQKKYPLFLKTAMIMTDYTCYPGIESTQMQTYFIPDGALAEKFAQHGIPKEKLAVTGIPVRRNFMKRTEKADAKRLLNIHAGNKHLLIMCGSMGCGPIEKMVRLMYDRLPENTEISVICGTNQRLQKKLERRYKESEKIHIVGYTEQMSLYMDSADLCLMKPGGLSVTEAAVKRLPMALINAVAGCEQYNIDYFVKMGAAVASDSPEELVTLCICILKSEKRLSQMRAAFQIQTNKRSDGAKLVFDLMENVRGVKKTREETDYEGKGCGRLSQIPTEQIKYTGI